MNLSDYHKAFELSQFRHIDTRDAAKPFYQMVMTIVRSRDTYNVLETLEALLRVRDLHLAGLGLS